MCNLCANGLSLIEIICNDERFAKSCQEDKELFKSGKLCKWLSEVTIKSKK